MNGVTPPNVQPGQSSGVPAGMDTPIAYYQPIAITPSTIKWICGVITAGFIFVSGLPVFDRYMNPASQKEFEGMAKVVQVLQQGQSDTQRTLERLTLAVDNLSGIVAELKAQQPRARIPLPVPKMR